MTPDFDTPSPHAGSGDTTGQQRAPRRTFANLIARALPTAMLVFALLYLVSAFRAPREDDFQLSLFGRLPIVDLGRIKPLDTFARTTLLAISTKQSFYLSGNDGTSERNERQDHRRAPAAQWLLDVMAKPDQARGYRVVRIDHPDIKSILGVDRQRKYFSIKEIVAKVDVLDEQFKRAREVSANDRTPFQRQVLKLGQRLNAYFSTEDVLNLLLVPPADESDVEGWMSFTEARGDAAAHDRLAAASDTYLEAMRSWREDDPAAFNATVVHYARTLDDGLPSLSRKMWFETLFNRVAPFLRSLALYVLVFLLAALSWLRMSRSLSTAALWVLGATLVMHTLGLVARVYIQGRPPVTNLYSSAIFVGWGAAILGLVLERIYRNGIGAVTAAGMGFLTLLLAHNLALDGDTMTMMQAVLDTNFWLATHVVVITLGYSATFLAGFLGILYVLRGVFTRSLTLDMQRSLSRMIYGIICFATLFSFVGTILGGIWADQSWGRFWGWDPKENGALLIVLWNALVLHARWGGMVRQRGLAVLSVGGNIVTAWSWFGTNMLGVGLHAYGFIDSAVFWMFVFVASQLAFIGLGSLPLHHWRSMQGTGLRSTAARPEAGQEEAGSFTPAAPSSR
jgi:ABC-type transport system involved in cytochrome c biogenesis permease subunit